MQGAIELIMQAVVAGIAAGLQPTATLAVKDGYKKIKEYLSKQYSVHLDNLEQKPESDIRQKAVIEALEDSNATADQKLLDAANELLSVIKKDVPNLYSAIKLERIKVEGDIEVSATETVDQVLDAKDVTAGGSFKVTVENAKRSSDSADPK